MSKPQLITKRDRVRNVAERFYEAYGRELDGPALWHADNVTKGDIYRKLLALDKETATVEEVNAIIGNESWTRLVCDQCDEPVDAVVQVGDEPDYESSTACLCRACLTISLSLITQ